MTLRTLENLSVTGHRVFVRVDFNVPHEKGSTQVSDDTRIREALPTLRYLMEKKAKIIVASHMGRPKGADLEESLAEVGARLSELLQTEVLFPEDCIGDGVKKLAHELREGQILLLENLRFHPEEEANDPQFAQALAGLADIYVTDAFGALHRAHASTVGMAKHFKEKGIGFLVQKEVEFLDRLLHRSERPFFLILGGAKISDKIGVIESLLSKVDGLFLGGGLGLTFLKASGAQVGKSKAEDEKLYLAQKIFQRAKGQSLPVFLPTDHRVIAEDKIRADAVSKIVYRIGPDEKALDIGPETVRDYASRLAQAKTIFWNGPLGVFEYPAFAEGTYAVARAVADSGAFSVVGGGESVMAVKKSGVAERISHLSTGGGASLEYLEGKKLPGLAVLEN